jgi:hypothetical protein
MLQVGRNLVVDRQAQSPTSIAASRVGGYGSNFAEIARPCPINAGLAPVLLAAH